MERAQSRAKAVAPMRQDSASRAARRVEIAERRAKVALMLRSKMEMQAIAQELKVANSTVTEDVKWIRQQYLMDAKRDLADFQAEEFNAINADERRLRTRLIGLTADDTDEMLSIMDRIFKLREQRMKLMGYAAPTRITLQDVREEAGRLAQEAGVDRDTVLREAERIAGIR